MVFFSSLFLYFFYLCCCLSVWSLLALYPTNTEFGWCTWSQYILRPLSESTDLVNTLDLRLRFEVLLEEISQLIVPIPSSDSLHSNG